MLRLSLMQSCLLFFYCPISLLHKTAMVMVYPTLEKINVFLIKIVTSTVISQPIRFQTLGC